MSSSSDATPLRWNRRTRILILLAGLILPQFVLIRPSVFGGKILLPLDFLQQPQVYLPIDPAHPPPTLHDRLTSDLVYLFEPNRQFIVSEMRAGRVPLWNPYNYCGVPCLASGQGAVFSPLRVLDYLWNDPGVLAWDRVLRAIVMGVGAYLFFRRVLGVGFAPAAIGAWCYPLTGFMTIWDGYTLPMVALWLPWMLLSIEETIRAPRSGWPIALALSTAAMILSGHPAMSLHVMAVSGLFAVWRVVARGAWTAPIALGLATFCGILLACPQILPSAEYLNHSYRVAQRRAGVQEPNSEGPQALLQMVLPYYYGSNLGESFYVITKSNRLESGAAGYAGLIVALVLAPLGWLNRRLRSFQVFWLILGFLAVAEISRFPVLGSMLDHPPFSVARGNRLVFASAFAILASGVAGLEELFSARSLRRRWLWCVCAALLVLCGLASYRAFQPEAQLDPVRAEAKANMERAGTWAEQKDHVESVLAAAVPSFWANHMTEAIVCGGALILLGLIQIDFLSPRSRGSVIAGAAILELMVMAWNLNAQCDSRLYYPTLPVFQVLRSFPPARVMMMAAFPADLNLTQRLYDIRGFDGADPDDYDEVLQHIIIPGTSPGYAPTQSMVPLNGPLFDSLGVRYVVFRGSPSIRTNLIWVGNDYWILENPRAAPRAFVPKSVRTLNDDKLQLDELLRPDFDPSRAFVEQPKTAIQMDNCEGSVRITAENPERIELSANMKTDGFVLLSDRWDGGWRATVNGKPEIVYRANRLFRAVQVPAGASTIVFTYSPLSFTVGCWCALTALGAIVWWGLHNRRRARAQSSDFV